MKLQHWKSLLFLFFLVILGISLSHKTGIVNAQWEQDTLGPDTARVVNVVDCFEEMVIDVTYRVTSGPSIDAYLCEGFITLLFGPPSDHILFDDDSSEGHWRYTVLTEGNYAVVFINDRNEDVVIQYLIETQFNPFGNFPFGALLLIAVPIGIIVIVIVIIVVVVILRRTRRQEFQDEGA